MTLTLQTDTGLAQFLPTILAAVLGAAYGGFKIWQGYDPDTGINKLQYAKTVLIWGVAGAVAQQSGDGHSYEAIAASVALVAPVINSVWDSFLPPAIGGSRSHGRGATVNAN